MAGEHPQDTDPKFLSESQSMHGGQMHVGPVRGQARLGNNRPVPNELHEEFGEGKRAYHASGQITEHPNLHDTSAEGNAVVSRTDKYGFAMPILRPTSAQFYGGPGPTLFSQHHEVHHERRGMMGWITKIDSDPGTNKWRAQRPGEDQVAGFPSKFHAVGHLLK
jgi:hypothetical protein